MELWRATNSSHYLSHIPPLLHMSYHCTSCRPQHLRGPAIAYSRHSLETRNSTLKVIKHHSNSEHGRHPHPDIQLSQIPCSALIHPGYKTDSPTPRRHSSLSRHSAEQMALLLHTTRHFTFQTSICRLRNSHQCCSTSVFKFKNQGLSRKRKSREMSRWIK